MAIYGDNPNFPMSRILMSQEQNLNKPTVPKTTTATALPVPAAAAASAAPAYTAPNPNYSLSGNLTGDLTETAAKQNLAGMDELTAMSNYINTLNIAAQQAALQARIPGSAGLEQQSSANIAAGLAGQIDPGTQRQIGEWAAARGIMSGSVGGPINDTAFLKLMSDTAYEREQQAQQNLSAAYARNPAAPIFDISSQLVSPGTLGQLTLGQAEALSREGISARELALRESLTGRELSENERAALVREQLARQTLEEQRRSALAQEAIQRDQIAAAAARAAASQGAGTTRQLAPQGITGPYVGGDVGRSFSSGTVAGTPSWTGPRTAEQVRADQLGALPAGTTPYATPAWGYQPTTQGTMYTGEVSGYDPELDAWLADLGYSPSGEPL